MYIERHIHIFASYCSLGLLRSARINRTTIYLLPWSLNRLDAICSNLDTLLLLLLLPVLRVTRGIYIGMDEILRNISYLIIVAWWATNCNVQCQQSSSFRMFRSGHLSVQLHGSRIRLFGIITVLTDHGRNWHWHLVSCIFSLALVQDAGSSDRFERDPIWSTRHR